MTCLEFETLWNERLDAIQRQESFADQPELPADSSTSAIAEMEDHAATCASCRALATRYRVLQHSIESLNLVGPPSPPGDFAARFLAEHEALLSSPRSPSHRISIRWSLAAAALLLAALGFFARRERPQDPILVEQSGEGAGVAIEEPDVTTVSPRLRPLNETLAEATSVTLSLVWEASEPAARLGRDVLGTYRSSSAPNLAEEVPVPLDITMIDNLNLPLNSSEVSERDVFRSIGEQVGGGVRPLSRPALNAFAFLMPKLPEVEELEGPETPP